MHPNGNELWVMVLEKMFAKFMGSYAATEGGYPLFAMQTITGKITIYIVRILISIVNSRHRWIYCIYKFMII